MKTHAGPPRVEDFGLSASTLENTPEAFFVRHRDATLVISVAATVVASGSAVFHMSGSLAASAFFAPILVIASLILVLPIGLGCVCAAGAVETWWRSLFDPDFAACARYRKARAALQRRPEGTASPGNDLRVADWLLCSHSELLAIVVDRLGTANVTPADRESVGYDLLFNDGECTRVIRCESGRSPIGAGVGRELQTVLTDTGCREAVLVAPAGPSSQLKQYLEGRSIRVFDAPALAGGGLTEQPG